MTLKRILLGGLGVGLISALMPTSGGQHLNWVAPAAADVDVSISVGGFYDNLAPYGGWTNYGGANVFIPSDIDAGWRPYTRGHWEYTRRYGWLWISNEPYGWATYHYGRWGYGDDIGWYWVPGTRWAPAWVSWRRSEDNVVWAPLPPSRGGGLSVDVSYGEPADFAWVAVPARSFLEVNIANVVIHDDRERRRAWQRARPLGHVRVVNNIVINNVVDVDFIERRAKRKVRAVEIADADNPREAGKRRGDAVAIYNPKVKDDPDARPAKVVDIEEVKKRQAERRRNRAETAATETGDDNATAKENRKKRRAAAAQDEATTDQPADNNRKKRRAARQADQLDEQQPGDNNRKKRREARQADQPDDQQTGDDNRKKRRAQRQAVDDDQSIQDNRQRRKARRQAAEQTDEQPSARELRRNKRRAQQATEESGQFDDGQPVSRKRQRRAAEQAGEFEQPPGQANRKQRRRQQQAIDQGEEAPAANRAQRRRNKAGCDPAVNPNCPQ